MSSGRIERCYTDNIYLIESYPPEEENERKYLIMGNSGREYNVKISNFPTCTCPDFRTRHNRCKHIFFVLIRIMNISNYTDREYTDEELSEMFMNIPPIARNLVYEGENNEEQKVVKQKFEKGDICPICLDELENGKELDYCKYSCGKTIHKKCFSMWEKSKGGVCVFCRGKWYNPFSIGNPKKVSMHPNGTININEEEKIEVENDIDNQTEIYENNDISMIEEEDNRRKKKKKKRNKSRNRSKSKSKSRNTNKSMSISSKSRSRSRDKSKNKQRNKKKYKYPKD